jgi:hypothetical protein
MIFVMPLKASVAPKPSAEREISANRRANAARALTPGAGCPGNFVVKDLLAKRDLVARCSWRYRQAGIGVNAFRRHSFRRSLGFDRRSGRGLNFCHVRVADIGTRQIRPALSSVMKSAPSGPTATTEGRCAARPGSLKPASETVGKDDVAPRRADARDRQQRSSRRIRWANSVRERQRRFRS